MTADLDISHSLALSVKNGVLDARIAEIRAAPEGLAVLLAIAQTHNSPAAFFSARLFASLLRLTSLRFSGSAYGIKIALLRSDQHSGA